MSRVIFQPIGWLRRGSTIDNAWPLSAIDPNRYDHEYELLYVKRLNNDIDDPTNIVCHECGDAPDLEINYVATQYLWMAACIPCASRAVATCESDDRCEIRPLPEERSQQ